MERNIITKWLEKCEEEKVEPWLWSFKTELLKENSNITELHNPKYAIKHVFNWYLDENNYENGETEDTNLAKAIYHVLWDVPMEQLNDNPLRLVDMDVMNSFWTTYRLAISYEYGNPGSKWKNGQINSDTFENLLNNFDNYANVNSDGKYGDFSRYALLTHTIGNYTLEPKFWNAGRYKSTKDYWDSTLVFFKAMEVLGFDYKSYVERFFMHDYCDLNNNYAPKPLWFGHKIPGAFEPGKDDIKEFITNVNNNIERRGKYMIKKLCEKLNMLEMSFYVEHQLKDFELV